MKKLPIGIEIFSEIVQDGYYYVDKTMLVKDLIDLGSKVTLFTRPRRFGKSLNMDMLKSFFETGSDKSIFSALKIAGEKELCSKFQSRFPVISISLKDIDGESFEDALPAVSAVISKAARQHQYLLQSEKLSDIDKEILRPFFKLDITRSTLESSLNIISEMLYKHYGEKVVILIDEYDVPLDKAFYNGYYDKMVRFIRVFLSSALKSNSSLSFAVLTGCLKIAKESIFTGLNNFKTISVSDIGFAGYFGFTGEEVKNLLEYYNLEGWYNLFKEWYDGYRFGNTMIYCPWDVINQCSQLCMSNESCMESHWINSSSNSIVHDILKNSTATTRKQIESLVSGEDIKQRIIPELTYQDLNSADNETRQTYLWSVLYSTGYLTDQCNPDGEIHTLVIPNKEIHGIYEKQILSWFRVKVTNNARWTVFCQAIENGEALQAEILLNEFMAGSISIRDTCSRQEMKENFYHGMLLGLLNSNEAWAVKSNYESGTGYADIIIETGQKGCVFEIKYARNGSLNTACENAIKQIKDKGYPDILKEDGVETIYLYGIAFYKKRCKIICKEEVQV